MGERLSARERAMIETAAAYACLGSVVNDDTRVAMLKVDEAERAHSALDALREREAYLWGLERNITNVIAALPTRQQRRKAERMAQKARQG